MRSRSRAIEGDLGHVLVFLATARVRNSRMLAAPPGVVVVGAALARRRRRESRAGCRESRVWLRVPDGIEPNLHTGSGLRIGRPLSFLAKRAGVGKALSLKRAGVGKA